MTSLQSVLDIAIPGITFFLMTVVGVDLTLDDFRRVKTFPRAFLVGTFLQYLLPVPAILTLYILHPSPGVAGGILLLACAPGGGISNYYTYVARANVALSVVLTATSCLLAAVTMPLLLHIVESYLATQIDFHVPLKTLFAQLLLLLVLPVVLGSGIRRFRPAFVQRFHKVFNGLGFFSLGSLIAFILYQTRERFAVEWPEITLSASVFIVICMMLGYLVGVVFQLNRKDTITLLIEFGVRNVGITTTAAVVLLNRIEFATLAATYFLVEAVLILSAVFCFRKYLAAPKANYQDLAAETR